MNSPNRTPNDAARWLPAVAAAGVLGAVVVAGVAMGGSGDSAETAASVLSVPSQSSVVSTLPVPDSVPNVIGAVQPDETVEKTQLDRTLSEGMAGDDVLAVQERLAELGFWLGEPDGFYGPMTRRAVWAYEKLVLGAPSTNPPGVVTPDMWEGLQESFVVQPRRPNATPNHTEVYLPEQVVAVFHGDVPQIILHMSSGDGEEWCEEVVISPGEWGNEEGDEPLVQGQCGVSSTPGGVFSVHREVEGRRESALGGMLNPVYFNYGIAIHGAYNVPLTPASHGCIRVVNEVSGQVQDLMGRGDQVFVWDGVKEPEEYGEQLPRFNWVDPEWRATSTTSTTTTAPTTTLAPEVDDPEPPAVTTTTTTTTTTTVADGGSTGGDTTGGDTGGDATTGGDTGGDATTGGDTTGGDTGGDATTGGDTGGDAATGGDATGGTAGGDTGGDAATGGDTDGATTGDGDALESQPPADDSGGDELSSSDAAASD